MTFLVRLLMYGAPVVYSISIIPENLRLIYSLNPMVGVIEGMRAIFLSTRDMPWQYIISGSVVSAILFIFGAFYFKRMERGFADIA
jgi:lipopolysaccharide transport system permease protein